jgi:hypothetical protein
MGRVSDLDLAQLFIVLLRRSWNFLGEEKFLVPFHLVGAHDARYRHRTQLPCFLACCCALTFPMEATALVGLDRTTLVFSAVSRWRLLASALTFFFPILLFLFVGALAHRQSIIMCLIFLIDVMRDKISLPAAYENEYLPVETLPNIAGRVYQPQVI